MSGLLQKFKQNPKIYTVYLLGRLLRGSVTMDKLYLKLLYRAKLHKKLDFKHPKTFNEKLQWLKVYDRNPEYTRLVDKYEVKPYVADRIGEEYIIPTLGVWDSFDEIDFDALPQQFVLKCTHDSGGLVICRDKSKLDIAAAREKIEHCLKRNYFYNTREWPYKNVKPRILAEKYMEDEFGAGLKDYKFFCFDGEVKVMFVASDRGIDTRFDFYDTEFHKLPLKQHYENGTKDIPKPDGFEKMLALASTISEGLVHARIDFYDINGIIYFGEITFYHFSGLEAFEPEQYDRVFGDWIKLPIKE